MCQCQKCSNKEMELLPEFEGMFGNEFEMEIDPEFGLGDLVESTIKTLSPVVSGAQKTLNPIFDILRGNSSLPNTLTPSPTRQSSGAVTNYLRPGNEREWILNLIAFGVRNENALTDIVFFRRHPKLENKKLYKAMANFDALSKEWISIRNNLIRPSLFANKEFETFYPEMEFEAAATIISMVDPKKVSCLTSPYKEAILKNIGSADPLNDLNVISNRAWQMLDSTIKELKNIKGKVNRGENPAAPLIRESLLWSMEKRMNMTPKKRSTWTTSAPRNAGLIIRWLTRIRDRISSKDLWFTCLDSTSICTENTWAYVYPGRFRVYLCKKFWNPGGADAATNIDFQAQIIIHEVSHIYYNTGDTGTGPGRAECIAQFIADANNSSTRPDFVGQCREANPFL
jgi:Lysine-specific metallo-endopeptidase